MTNNKVYIIVLNYNGWADTIECLESLLKINYPDCQIVVVDNNSSDNSCEYFRSWAEGNLNVWVRDNNPLRQHLQPVRNYAVPYVEFRRQDVEKGGTQNTETSGRPGHGESFPRPLIIIRTECNLGFAGGNNVGIRYALNKGDCDYIWLINNDTVVEEYTLTHLVEKAKESPNSGAVGSVHLDYVSPDTIQTLGGGRLIKYLGITRNTFPKRSYTELLKHPSTKKPEIDFVSGCSMLVSKEVLSNVGLLDEEYFVYWEDADWSERIKRHGFLLTSCLKSKVFHKISQSSSIHTSSYFSTLNCFRFYRKNYPALVPIIFFTRLIFIFAIGLKHRNIRYVKGALRAYAASIKTEFSVTAHHVL